MKRNTVSFLIFLTIVILFVVYYSICTREGLSEKEKALSNPVVAMSTGIPNQVLEFRRNSFLTR